VFAVSSIPRPTLLGLTHVWTYIDGYKQEIIRTPLGGFINHSDNPNCFLYDSPSFGGSKYLCTVKDIKEGEELTVKYGMYDPTGAEEK